jgi:DNA invertase Pin-like site-specific DNA recombinase
MLIGYARVSKQQDQDTATQVQALKKAGAERIFQEHASGGRWDRPELHKLLDQLRAGDVLVVWKLDRLSRSLKDLLHLLDGLNTKEAGFMSITEHIDTTTPAGRMMLQMVGAFAEFEREMIRERTRAGLETACAQGRVGGRKPKLSAQQQGELIRGVQEERYSMAEAARLFQVHPSTVTRLMSQQPRPVAKNG